MGCKCESGDKAEIISIDISLENMREMKPPLSTRITPIKQLEDNNNDILTGTKNSSFTDHYLIKNHNNKIKEIDKIFLCQGLLNEINDARQAPKAYAAKIEKYKHHIYTNDKGIFLAANRNTSISLKTGLKAFDDCIMYLNQQASLPPLRLVNELQLSIQNDNCFDKMIEYQYLGKALANKRLEVCKRYIVQNFHYDKNICMPEVSAVIQIVDDTNSNYRRRKNIFHKESKVIGINCEKINGTTLCYYLLFGVEV